MTINADRIWRYHVPKERKMVVVAARIESNVEHAPDDITDASAKEALERLWEALDPASVVRAVCPIPATESLAQSIGPSDGGAKHGDASVPLSDLSVTKSQSLEWQQRPAMLESEIEANVERGIREAISDADKLERAAADTWAPRQRRKTLSANDPRIPRLSNSKPRSFLSRIVERVALGVAALALLGVSFWMTGHNPFLRDTTPIVAPPITATTDPELKPQMPARISSQTLPAWLSPQIFYSPAVAPSAAPPQVPVQD
jgi:hypothetical protein